MHRITRLLAGVAMLLAPLAALFLGGGTALAATCSPAGTTGLTAAIVATGAQYITGTIDATGCDIGIYVGPSGAGTIISFANVSNAGVHGILIQDTSNVQVRFSTVSNNAPGGETFPETKAIQAEGSRNVAIVRNTVTDNGGGGIAITDDGPFNPGAPNAGSLHPGYGDVVAYNFIQDNTNGCGLVVSAYNPGAGVSGNLVDHNTVVNNPAAGIVIAADAPNTTATNNSVTNNTSAYNGYAGIIVHSNAPGDVVSNTLVQNNIVHNNGGRMLQDSVQAQLLAPLPGSFGIIVSAPGGAGTILMTYVSVNQISNEYTGIGHSDDVLTIIAGNGYSNVVIPVGFGV